MTNHTYKLGDRILLQKDGGPIGLEATGAISRAYMMHYDRLYLEAVEEAGIRMLLYNRYIDDSQQAALDDSDSEVSNSGKVSPLFREQEECPYI